MRFPFEVSLKRRVIENIVSRALKEDIGDGDVTTLATVRGKTRADARLELKARGVVAGMSVFEAVFRVGDPGIKVAPAAGDGGRYGPGYELARVSGKARSILTCERVALNFIQHMSGIATLTSRFVGEVAGTGVRIVDTRKTIPGLRYLEKYSVLVGGGFNHRPRLSDLALIKDNHIKAAGTIGRAVRRVRRANPRVLVEVEVGPETDPGELTGLDIDIVMLDNWPLNRLRRAVRLVRNLPGRPAVEVSGKVRLDNVRRIALCEPDFISVGLITHSSPSLDMSLDL